MRGFPAPSGLCGGDEEIVFRECAPALCQTAGFRGHAGKATKGPTRNEDGTRKMLQQHQEKGIHRMHHNHDHGQITRLLQQRQPGRQL